MNCIEKDNFIHSRLDNTQEYDNIMSSEPVTPHQESLHSFRFSSSSSHSRETSSNTEDTSSTSSDLALALSKQEYKEWMDHQQKHLSSSFILMENKLLMSQQQNKKAVCSTKDQQQQQTPLLLDSNSSSNSSDKSTSTPVTPEDREFVSLPLTRSKSNTKRHCTQFTPLTLYPSTSSQTSSNTNTKTKSTATTSTASRYLPQNQAVITTQDNWRISLVNHIATTVFSSESQDVLVGKHILDFIDVSHRPLLLDRIVKRRENQLSCSSLGSVLICGDIIPIVKQDGIKSSASLWLKEKKNHGSSIFIWIFEEVFSSAIQVLLENGQIVSVNEQDVFELFGYTRSELLQQPITTLIPHYNSDNTSFFAGARTKLQANFPVMVKQVGNNSIRIISMPTLAGLVTVNQHIDNISSCNAAFSKYLFGYSMINNSISTFLPQFKQLISCLERDDLLNHDCILNNDVCRDVLGKGLTAQHQDGTLFDIELQIKLLEETKEYALWITFDRDAVFARYGHTTSKQQQFEKEASSSPTVTVTNEMNSFIRSKSINIPTSTTSTDVNGSVKAAEATEAAQVEATVKKKKSIPSFMIMTNTNTNKKPTVATTKITSFSRPTFTSSKSAIQTTKQHMINSSWPIGEYSAQTLKTNIVDYDIISELGQGAYGVVKLAHLKNDPEKKRVVIKYVIKSRILVDCWTRDRKLGLIPAEIHVLHTLRKIPHINCSDMLDYFEDDDYYYIVIDLYGAGMDLFDYIELKHGGMPEPEIRSIFKQIVSAVKHLHDHRIVHRDIKDENVILDSQGGVRLIDFGSAAYIKQGKTYETFVGTLDYAAPEILKGQAYTGPPQDVWACGTLLYTLIYRENPFYNIDEIMEHELRIPFVLSEESVDLISKMLDRNVDTRLTIHQVLEHPWFQSN